MEPTVAVRNLNHAFGQGMLRKPVLSDVNLDIYPGEIVILTGPSRVPLYTTEATI